MPTPGEDGNKMRSAKQATYDVMNPRLEDWGASGDLDGLIPGWAYKDFHLITDLPADQGDRVFLSLRTSRDTLDQISERKQDTRR